MGKLRSRRLIKKLCKKLSVFYSDAWECEDDEDLDSHYVSSRPNYMVSAKGILHVGGEPDYCGEGTEIYTVLEMAMENFYGWASFCGCQSCQDQFDPDINVERCEETKGRLKLRPTFKNLKMALELGA